MLHTRLDRRIDDDVACSLHVPGGIDRGEPRPPGLLQSLFFEAFVVWMRLQAVYCHLKVFILAVGADKGVNELLDSFYGRALPNTYPLREVASSRVNWKFELWRYSL